MNLPTGLARVAVLLMCLTLLVTATLLPTTAEARAGAPVPAPKTFGPVADGFPQWERESSCSPTEKPGAAALRRLLRRTYGTSIASNIVRGCTSADSGHEEGRAIDWMTDVRVPGQRAMAEAFIAWLQATDGYGNTVAMARRLGVEYLIWNNRMWRTYDPGRGWTEYSGCLAKKKRKRAYDNACHRTHVHISLSWDGAYKRTSYFSGYVACPTPPPAPPAVPLPGEGLDFVAVPPARLLTTTNGTGTTTGPCRVRGGARLDLPVLGRGGVPTDGVAAVVLRVALSRADSSTSLRVWPTGAAMPTDPVATSPGQGSALVTVPVGAGGLVSLQHSGGMSHLTADVVGYYLAPGLVGGRFHVVSPVRVVAAKVVAPGASVAIDLGAASAVTGVDAGLLSVTVSGATAAGSIAVSPSDAAQPARAALSFAAREAVTSTVLARAGADGRALLLNTSTAPVTVSVDLQGVYAPAAVAGGLQLVVLPQGRLVKTTKDVGVTGALTPGRTAAFPALGLRGVPASGVGAVLLYAMAINPVGNTGATLWTEGQSRPGVRQLSPRAGRSSGDLLAVEPGPSGLVAVRSSPSTTDLMVDVAGYFR